MCPHACFIQSSDRHVDDGSNHSDLLISHITQTHTYTRACNSCPSPDKTVQCWDTFCNQLSKCQEQFSNAVASTAMTHTHVRMYACSTYV